MKKISVIALLICVVMLLCSCGAEKEIKADEKEKNNSSSVVNIDLVPDFEAENIYGEKIDEEIIEDSKVTMINIWGTFCTPALEEMPYIDELYQKYSSEGFSALGIVIDAVNQDYSKKEDTVKQAQSIVEDLGLTYENIIPSKELFDGEMATNQFIPVTYFVDSKGTTLTEKYIGKRSSEEWEEIIKSLLEKQ